MERCENIRVLNVEILSAFRPKQNTGRKTSTCVSKSAARGLRLVSLEEGAHLFDLCWLGRDFKEEE